MRRRGLALVNEELEPGVRSVAVPIGDGRRVIGPAAGIVADAQRVSVTTLRRTLLPVLRVAAEKIASDLALSRGRRPAG